MDALEQARKAINEIDAQMAELFVKRMHAAAVIGAYKKERGLPITDARREQAVIERNSALVDDETIRSFYVGFLQNNMALSRAYQRLLTQGLRVAYSGTEGAFAHMAAGRIFPEADRVGFGDFASAYAAVEAGDCDLAVLPVENSYNGEVGQVTDLLFSGSLYLNSMYDLPVTQDLLGVPGATLADVTTALSHPQALGQCATFLRAHGIAGREFENTALAAKHVAKTGDKSLAAIGSKDAAERYGLCVLQSGIQESAANTTRFAVLSRIHHKNPSVGAGINSVVVFTARNEPGSLAEVLSVIGRHGYNMRTMRSRPMKSLAWNYYFYIEIEGNIDTEEGQAMLSEIAPYCDRMKVVGGYSKQEA